MASQNVYTAILLGILLAFVVATQGDSVLDKAAIPPRNPDGGPVKVKLTLSLINLAKADTDDNEIDIYAWPTYQWSDPRLVWSTEKGTEKAAGANQSSVRVWAKDIWTPDVTAFNAVKKTETITPNLAVVYQTGDVIYVPSVRVRILCDLAGLGTSEGATCRLKMGSWTFSSQDLTLDEDTNISLADFFSGSKYEITGTNATKNSQKYPCCPERYEDITFSITVVEKSGEARKDEVQTPLEHAVELEKVVEANVDKDMAKEVERLVRSQMKKNSKRGTVMTRSKGYTKSFIWQG